MDRFGQVQPVASSLNWFWSTNFYVQVCM